MELVFLIMRWVNFHKWVIVEDCYRFRKFPQDSFDFVLDIGAATGMFSIMARVLNPNAVIAAIEPDSIPYRRLITNVKDLGIYAQQIALGDGGPRYRLLKDRIGRTMFSPDPTDRTDEVVESARLSSIFHAFGGNSSLRYYIKVDCEAGEQWLVGHKPSEEILYNAAAIGMKLHFPSDHPRSPRWYNEPWAKPWDFYHEWWTGLFTDHDVVYERSSRKTGYGHLLIEKR